MFKVKEGIELFGDAELRHPTGDYGSVEIDGGPGTSGYEGYSIGGRSVFMHDNSVTSGIYNDVNNHWLWRGIHGGGSYMYYNGGIQLSAESGYALANNQMRSPIFYDSNNTAYYLDPASTSNIVAMRMKGNLSFDNYGLGVIGYYTSTRLQNVFAMDDQYKISDDGTSVGNHYGIVWSHSNAGTLGGANNLAGHGMILLTAGVYDGSWGEGKLDTPGSIYSPIYYDRNDTAYYQDPASTSRMNSARLNSLFVDDGSYAQLVVGDTAKNGDTYDVERPTLQLRGGHYPHLTLDGSLTNAGTASTNTNHGPVISFLSNLSGGTGFRRWSFGAPSRDASALSWGVYDNNANPHYGLGGDLGWSSYGSKMWLNTGGHLQTTGSMRSPIFYDSNDTSYFVDPTSSSHVKHIEVAANTASSLYYDAAIEVRETNYGGSQTDSWAYAPRIGLHWGGRVASQIALGSNGRVHILNNPGNDNEDFQAKIVYADKLVDRNDNNYYVDPNDGNFSAHLAGTVNANQGFSTEGGSLRITHPGGASYATGTSTVTGAMKITLPVGYTNTMLRFTIKVYEYTTGESYEINVGGYNYATGWINPSAYIVAQPGTHRNHTVRFGFDGSKCCVYVGETSSTWSYPQVTVSDFQAGYSNYGRDMWNNGWSIGFATSFGTITQTLSNVQIGRTQAIVYDRDNSSYYIDSASTSRLNAITANKIHCVGSATNTAPRWDTSFHVAQSQHFYGHSSTQTMYIGESNHIHIRNIGEAAGDFRAPLFADSSNTAYFTDPAGASNLNIVKAVNSFCGDEVYYPTNAKWSAAGNTTGMIWIRLPGTASQYDMVNIEIDIYEYSSNAGTKLYVSGHNWTTGWANSNVQIVGPYDGGVYLHRSANYYYIALGHSTRTWSYGCVQVTKVTTAGFYNVIDWRSGWSVFLNASNPETMLQSSSNWNGSSSKTLRTLGSHQGTYAYFTRYYDTNNTTYYVDPSSTSNLFNVTVNGVLTETSDIRIKSDIKRIGNALEKVQQLSGYTYKVDGIDARKTGVIAQEVEEVLPEAVTGDTLKSVAYGNMVGLLIEAIKEQQSQIETLKSEIQSLKGNL